MYQANKPITLVWKCPRILIKLRAISLPNALRRGSYITIHQRYFLRTSCTLASGYTEESFLRISLKEFSAEILIDLWINMHKSHSSTAQTLRFAVPALRLCWTSPGQCSMIRWSRYDWDGTLAWKRTLVHTNNESHCKPALFGCVRAAVCSRSARKNKCILLRVFFGYYLSCAFPFASITISTSSLKRSFIEIDDSLDCTNLMISRGCAVIGEGCSPSVAALRIIDCKLVF